MNKLSIHDLGSIKKLAAVGCVLAPGPESIAQKYEWAYMEEDMKNGDAGGIKFRLPQGKGVLDLFPEGSLEDDKKIVMMAVPTTIAFGYGANPPSGSLEEASEELAEVNEDVDLDQLGMMIKILEHNDFYLYHRKYDDGDITAGILVDNLEDDFVRSIGGLEYLQKRMITTFSHLRNNTRNGRVVEENVTEHELLALANWLEDNPEEVSKYIQETGVKETKTRTNEQSNKEENEEGKAAKMLPAEKFAWMCLKLILSTQDEDRNYHIGEIRKQINAGFLNKKACNVELFRALRKDVGCALKKLTDVTYTGMKQNPCTPALYQCIMNCRFSKEDPIREEPGTFSLASCNLFGKDDIDNIESNNYDVQMDADVGQASQNSTKIFTKNLKFYDFRSLNQLTNATKALSAEFITLLLIKVLEGEPINDVNIPVCVRLLNRWTILFASQDFRDWFTFHYKEHKHLLISIAHKLAACFAKIMSACCDWETVTAAEKGEFPG